MDETSLLRVPKTEVIEQFEKKEEVTYEIEKILDYVSFLDAYERYYNEKRSYYADIFSETRMKRSQGTHLVSKYFFRVKWLGYDRNNSTWEPEETVPSACYLSEFKKLNNLPAPFIKLRVKLGFRTKRQGYISPVVLGEKTKRFVRPTDKKMNEMTFSLNDEVDNGYFGLVPIGGFKRKMRQGIEYLKKGKEIYMIEENLIGTFSPGDSVEVIKSHQKKDRTFLQIMIRHVNIVHMKDCFATCKDDKTVSLTSVFEWCHQSLRQKVSEEKVVDWKSVCRDILSALAFVHVYGIHRGVSLDSVFYHSNGTYKLSDFNSFIFGDRVPIENMRSDGIELSPRKYLLSRPFDATIDIYALAIILLQCKKNLLFRIEPQTVTEIEEDIRKAMNAMDNDDDRHFVKMMLRAREHIHSGLGRHRFSAASLMEHPVLNRSRLESIECVYIHDMLGSPINERIYYKAGDTVENVINRHSSLYHHKKKDAPQYLMVSTEDVTESNSKVVVIDKNEDFSSVVNKDVTAQNSQLLIFPIISLADHLEKADRKNYLLNYSQELGSCPIMLEAEELTAYELAQVLRKKVISRPYRQFQINVFAMKHEEDSGIVKYTRDQYVMKVILPDKVQIINRFNKARERERDGLSAEELEWDDVAGDRHESIIRKEKKQEEKLSRKRAHEANAPHEMAVKRKKTERYLKKLNENLQDVPIVKNNQLSLEEVKTEPFDDAIH